MARPEAGDAEVRAAAALAGALGFIEALPEGFESWIGQQGLNLSGGQRQRLGIARAVLRDPDLLILDEATNALEAALEDGIRAGLRRAFAGRTLVLVTHREDGGAGDGPRGAPPGRTGRRLGGAGCGPRPAPPRRGHAAGGGMPGNVAGGRVGRSRTGCRVARADSACNELCQRLATDPHLPFAQKPPGVRTALKPAFCFSRLSRMWSCAGSRACRSRTYMTGGAPSAAGDRASPRPPPRARWTVIAWLAQCAAPIAVTAAVQVTFQDRYQAADRRALRPYCVGGPSSSRQAFAGIGQRHDRHLAAVAEPVPADGGSTGARPPSANCP